jgi:hypothetical protein
MKQVYLYVGGGVAEITPHGSERKDFVKLSRFGQKVELEPKQYRECVLAGVALLTEQEFAAIGFDDDAVKQLARGGRESVSRFDPLNPNRSNAINLKLLKLDEAVGKSRAAARNPQVAPKPPAPKPEPKSEPAGGEN